ncbi:hypothetical protein HanRHA438_Chr02g0085051 [Helianthus annuus]|nr:hypothetical protein HanHA300_Chr02g0061381 [Helianthus annuus]KAJ0616059.1 hypothetical protein HanIR_Chr02g0086301 [Helianthus annuus]KAJ0619305.1 hypothetical protein HanHA89_Chr02g0069891 [Helianthus annuus]KAJ0940582.1 hypothetical protein HanRHA438_Chr02g0085051 [Helianthus annuus]KAJ0952351.1 hypothetical protein HanPSC8_Chr02g0071251 [Helianthus annuus]
MHLDGHKGFKGLGEKKELANMKDEFIQLQSQCSPHVFSHHLGSDVCHASLTDHFNYRLPAATVQILNVNRF